MFLLTLRDLQFRAVRFGIAIVGTALVFAMVLLMSGLSAQFRNEPQTTVEAVGGDNWVIPKGVTGAFTSGATLPDELADQLKSAGAEAATPSRSSGTPRRRTRRRRTSCCSVIASAGSAPPT